MLMLRQLVYERVASLFWMFACPKQLIFLPQH
jgi:hypothetical protein